LAPTGDDEDYAFGSFLLNPNNWDYVVLACSLELEATKGSVKALTRREVEHLEFLFEVRDVTLGARVSLFDAVLGDNRVDEAVIETAQLREWLIRSLDATAAATAAASSLASLPASLEAVMKNSASDEPMMLRKPSGIAELAELASGTTPTSLTNSSVFPSILSGSKTVVTVDGAYRTTVVRRHGVEGIRVASGSHATCRTFPAALPSYGSPGYIVNGTPCAKIIDCTESVIYLLEPYDYVSIVGCVDCVIVVGAIARSLHVEACERVTLMCATKRSIVRSCFDCTFHLGIVHQPIFIGDNRKCVLAPYNTFYERLEEHLAAARLAPVACNAWDRPVVLGADVTIHDSSGSSKSSPDVVRISSGVSLMPPDAFGLFIVPFRECATDEADLTAAYTMTTQANPFETPANYVAALDAKMQRVNEVRARVRDAELSDAKRSDSGAL
jgi:TBCC domain-containing protein 1